MKPPGNLGLETPLLARIGSAPLVLPLEWMDASGEGFDAPGARGFASEVWRRGFRSRDRATAGDIAVGGARDVEAGCRRWFGLAVAGGSDRYDPRGQALW